jgi:hypothetical protein
VRRLERPFLFLERGRLVEEGDAQA